MTAQKLIIADGREGELLLVFLRSFPQLCLPIEQLGELFLPEVAHLFLGSPYLSSLTGL